MSLDIGPGVSVTSLTYVIGGPDTYTNTITVGDAQSVEFVVGGIVAGSGYTLSVTGQDSAGDPCSGATTTPFTIVAGAVTQTTLAITCVAPADSSVLADVNTGSLEVDASATLVGTAPPVCPGISSFSISPSELAMGQSSALSLSDTDPTALIEWSAAIGDCAGPGTSCTTPGGGFFGPGTGTATASTPTTTFTCDLVAPQVTIIATVSPANEASAAVCSGKPFTTMTALVNCEGEYCSTCDCPTVFGDPTAATLCFRPDGAKYCINSSTDVNNCGGCGIVCHAEAGATATCTHGVCD